MQKLTVTAYGCNYKEVFCGAIKFNWNQCEQKKIAKCLKKLPKNDFFRKMIVLTPLQKLLKNVKDLGKLIVVKGFKKLAKVQ